MRIIPSPHDVTFAEEVYQVQSHQIRLIGRPDLALKDLTRHGFQRDVVGFLALELSLIPIVHLLDDKRDPADRRFSETELQLGMAFQGSEIEHIYKRIEERRCAVAKPHAKDALALPRFNGAHRGPSR